MQSPFYTHLNKFVEVDEKDFPKICSYMNLRTVPKKEHLFIAGDKCKTNYFVLSGCLHMYFIDENGVGKTIQFGIENWWITDYLAFTHQKTTGFFLQAVENTRVLMLGFQQQRELFKKFPAVESYFRMIYQIAFGAALMRTKYIFNSSKEEIFFKFQEQYPEFVQRVPQYLIASFLGLTPEYLSEIKRKKRS